MVFSKLGIFGSTLFRSQLQNGKGYLAITADAIILRA